MESSTLTEAQKLHHQFQQYQLQQQQQHQQQQQQQIEQQQQQQYIHQEQQQDIASQPYDPSQAQAYDQATQAYYAYYQQQQQHYPYYPPDYANAYHHQQQPSQPESTPVQPPGISIQPESSQPLAAPAGQGQDQDHHQKNAFYPQGVGEQQNPPHPVQPGLNPAAAAAAAALSQLTQFAGTMGAAERAMAEKHEREWQAHNGGFGSMPGPGPMMYHGPDSMHPPAGRSPYRGRGRRGGGSFRRGGQGHFGHHHHGPDGSVPPFRGRGWGRGRGGGRRFPPHGAASAYPYPATAPVEELAALMEGEVAPSVAIQGYAPQALVLPPSATASGQTPLSAPARRHAARIPHPSQIAWCELCRVDCSSLEILEQHKNGKRHKKNLQRCEEVQNANKPMFGIQNEQKLMAESKPEVMMQPENAQGGEEENKPPPENLPPEAINGENKMETEDQNDLAEQSEVAMAEPTEVSARRPRMDRFDARRQRGIKRKMRGGRGGKRMRFNEAPRRPVEPPKPKEVIPLICDLCNVKCEAQAAFDAHLAGKKHLSKLKRFQGHQAMFGNVGLQVLYPANPNTQPTYFIPQGHRQTVYGPQGTLPQPAAYISPQAQQVAVAAGSDTRPQQESKPPGSQVIPEPGSQKAITLEPKPQQAVQDPQGSIPQSAAYMPLQDQQEAVPGSETQPQQDSKPQGLQVTADPGSEKAIILEPKPQQAANEPQGSFPDPAAYTPPQAQQVAPAGSEIQPQQDSKPQESDVTLEPVSQNAVTLEHEVPQKSATIEPETQQARTLELKSENGIPNCEGKDDIPPLGN